MLFLLLSRNESNHLFLGDVLWSENDSCTKSLVVNDATKIINELQSLNFQSPWREFVTKDSEKYKRIEDQLTRYIHQVHKWNPVCISIETIHNHQTVIKWNESKIDMFDPVKTANLFYSTNSNQADALTLHGTQVLGSKPLALPIKPDKCVHKLCHKGKYTIVLFEVLMGKTVITDEYVSDVRSEGYDSAYVKNDCYEAYILEDIRQALPKHVIRYCLGGLTLQGLKELLPDDNKPIIKNVEKYFLKSNRYCNHANDHDLHYLIGESQFVRIQSQRKSYRNLQLDSVIFCINRTLIRRFLKLQKDFEMKYGKAEPQLMFHGSSFSQNVESILNNGFDSRKVRKGIYGTGFHFCEFPEASINYIGTSKRLILCYVLLGSFVKDTQINEIPDEYDSRSLRRDREGRGEIVIVKSSEQVLPMYILNLQ